MNPNGTFRNLKPFKPGQSGNPKGRPKKEYCLTNILRAQSEIQDFETPEGVIARKQAIADKLWEMAIAGDMAAIKYIFDRMDGKPLQQQLVQSTNNPDNEFFVIVKHVEAVKSTDLKNRE